MNDRHTTSSVDMVIFDFGGVLAESGFTDGLHAIAAKHGLDKARFYDLADHLIHTTGYLTGHVDEHVYWQNLRDKTGITDDNTTLHHEILSRFVLRPWMFELVERLKASGVDVAILSDQTNWLDELNDRDNFFQYFSAVFNSYHLGKNKTDVSHFADTISRLGSTTPERILFVDDKEAHCKRAREAGMKAIRFVDRDSFFAEIRSFYPFL